MKKFLVKFLCMITFESYGSSSESDDDSESNGSDSATSLSSAMEDSHLTAVSLYESRIQNVVQLENKLR